MRASNAEREDALRSLSANFSEGRLNRAEFDERADAALAARTRDELRALFADLPTRPLPDIARQDDAAHLSADAGSAAAPGQPRRRGRVRIRRAPLFPLVPILLALSVIAVVHGLPPFPLIALLAVMTAGRRGRRWNRGEARPWL